jgi:hypothetical protein
MSGYSMFRRNSMWHSALKLKVCAKSREGPEAESLDQASREMCLENLRLEEEAEHQKREKEKVPNKTQHDDQGSNKSQPAPNSLREGRQIVQEDSIVPDKDYIIIIIIIIVIVILISDKT